jgi:hypothetical protein
MRATPFYNHGVSGAQHFRDSFIGFHRFGRLQRTSVARAVRCVKQPPATRPPCCWYDTLSLALVSFSTRVTCFAAVLARPRNMS